MFVFFYSGADQCASLHSATCCSSPCCFPDSVNSGSHHSDGRAYSETAQESRRRNPQVSSVFHLKGSTVHTVLMISITVKLS